MNTSYRKLNNAGRRFTHQRALIMDIIRQGHGHLDADEIFLRAREMEPRLSLSTVYRTLQMLKKLDIVDELHFSENHHHYEVKPTQEHHHLVCLGCGRVIEFDYPLSRYLKREVAALKDFDIDETEIRVAGYCKQCRRSQG
jgi:Fe2+ or Zn2+ uptake regulation protein